MARKVFISFLDTTNYVEFKYLINDKIYITKFALEAMVQHNCENWGHNDAIYVFATLDAVHRNWYDHGHYDPESIYNYEGLQTRLYKMQLEVSIHCIEIGDMRSKNDIWNLFQIITNEITKEYTEIYFDMTHSDRFLPTFAMVFFNYMQYAYKIQVKWVGYAFNDMEDERSKTLKDRRVAYIMDFTSLVELQNWTYATATYLENGNANSLIKLAKEKGLDSFAEALKNVMLDFQTCRSIPIVKGNHFKNLITSLPKFNAYHTIRKDGDADKEIIIDNQLNFLVDKIKAEVDSFKYDNTTLNADNINNGYKAAIWCFNNQLYQQAITILQENIITESCNSNSDTNWKNGFTASKQNQLKNINDYLRVKYQQKNLTQEQIQKILEEYDKTKNNTDEPWIIKKKRETFESDLKKVIVYYEPSLSMDLKHKLCNVIEQEEALDEYSKEEFRTSIKNMFPEITYLKKRFKLADSVISLINKKINEQSHTLETYNKIIDNLNVTNLSNYKAVLTELHLDETDFTEMDKILKDDNYDKSDRKLNEIQPKLNQILGITRIPRNDYNHAGFAYGSSNDYPDGWTNKKLIEEIAKAFDSLIKVKYPNDYKKSPNNPDSYIWEDNGFKRIVPCS